MKSMTTNLMSNLQGTGMQVYGNPWDLVHWPQAGQWMGVRDRASKIMMFDHCIAGKIGSKMKYLVNRYSLPSCPRNIRAMFSSNQESTDFKYVTFIPLTGEMKLLISNIIGDHNFNVTFGKSLPIALKNKILDHPLVDVQSSSRANELLEIKIEREKGAKAIAISKQFKLPISVSWKILALAIASFNKEDWVTCGSDLICWLPEQEVRLEKIELGSYNLLSGVSRNIEIDFPLNLNLDLPFTSVTRPVPKGGLLDIVASTIRSDPIGNFQIPKWSNQNLEKAVMSNVLLGAEIKIIPNILYTVASLGLQSLPTEKTIEEENFLSLLWSLCNRFSTTSIVSRLLNFIHYDDAVIATFEETYGREFAFSILVLHRLKLLNPDLAVSTKLEIFNENDYQRLEVGNFELGPREEAGWGDDWEETSEMSAGIASEGGMIHDSPLGKVSYGKPFEGLLAMYDAVFQALIKLDLNPMLAGWVEPLSILEMVLEEIQEADLSSVPDDLFMENVSRVDFMKHAIKSRTPDLRVELCVLSVISRLKDICFIVFNQAVGETLEIGAKITDPTYILLGFENIGHWKVGELLDDFEEEGLDTMVTMEPNLEPDWNDN
jgi:hypothetical protein